jgi:hypothetical protein
MPERWSLRPPRALPVPSLHIASTQFLPLLHIIVGLYIIGSSSTLFYEMSSVNQQFLTSDQVVLLSHSLNCINNSQALILKLTTKSL